MMDYAFENKNVPDDVRFPMSGSIIDDSRNFDYSFNSRNLTPVCVRPCFGLMHIYLQTWKASHC